MHPFIEERNPSGLTDVPGFNVAAVACDIRGHGNTERNDLVLVRSEKPCVAAGVFTTNVFAAAPVMLCRAVLAGKRPVIGAVVNSGNANACTGAHGEEDALAMQSTAVECCGMEGASVFVCSTGRIGRRLPIDRVLSGIRKAGEQLGSDRDCGLAAAQAILTSDSHEKLITVRIPWNGEYVTIAAMAKGAGMIQPNMATMLAFIATDAVISQEAAQQALASIVQDTFNAITVDGDQSTNDTVLLLANGVSGICVDSPPSEGSQIPLWDSFLAGLRRVCMALADMIVADGEKITKVVEILVRNAATRSDAESVARSVGNSLLVKSSWFGNDPNWGRILDAAGYAGAVFDPNRVRLFYKDYPAQATRSEVPVFIDGEPKHEHHADWCAIVAQKRFTIILDLQAGEAAFRLLATDLTEGYVAFNKSE